MNFFLGRRFAAERAERCSTPLPAALLALLGTVMVVGAETLEWTRPKEFFAAAVGRDVVTNGCSFDDLILKAHDAQGMSAQLRLSDRSPTLGAIPRSPGRVISASIGIALALECRALGLGAEGLGACWQLRNLRFPSALFVSQRKDTLNGRR